MNSCKFALRNFGGPLIAIFVSMTLFSGCAVAPLRTEQLSVTPEPGTLSLLGEQQKIYAIVYLPPRFDVKTGTLSYVLGGVWALGAQESIKARVAKLDNLEDPTVRVRTHFHSKWRNALKADNIVLYEPPLSREDLDKLRTTISKGMILDFKTMLWQLRLDLSAGAGHYRVDYEARGRLIRLDDSRTLWQGSCSFMSKSAPHVNDLLSNNGAVLKATLEEAADSCAQQLWMQFFINEARQPQK